MTRTTTTLALAGLALGLAMTSLAQAAPVTYLFGGQVQLSSLTPTANAGDRLSGSFTFDDTAADGNPDPTIGVYSDAISSLTFDVGSYSASSTGGTIVIGNDTTGSTPFDSMLVTAGDGPNDNLGPPLGAFEPTLFRFVLFDILTLPGANDPFSSDALTFTPVSISDFLGSNFTFQLFNANTQQFAGVTGFIDTLTAVASDVPAPAASLLLIVGLAAVGLRRRTKT